MGMYLDFDFLDVAYKNLAPEQGRVLVSEPTLRDTYFKRSVVLLTEHTENGTVGFVLNKPMEVPIYEVFDGFPEFDASVYVGGPVAKDTVHFLHTLGDLLPNSMHILGNIYWGGDFDQLKQLIREGLVTPGQVRFFLGYSGWAPGQLERELKEKAWVVTKMDAHRILSATAHIWEEMVTELGDSFQVWANFPENPAMN
jgi:putative transcriptional regulator